MTTQMTKQQREAEMERQRLERDLEAERQSYMPYLQTLFRAVQKLNVVHLGVYFQSQYRELPPLSAKERKAMGELPFKFNCASFGLFDQVKQEYLRFDFPVQKRPEDQFDLDRLRQFRLDDQWFCFSFKDQQANSPAIYVYEARLLQQTRNIDQVATIAAIKSQENNILFICYSDQLDQTKIQISSSAIYSAADSKTGAVPKVVIEDNSFVSQKSPFYDLLYEPSEQEVEVKVEEKQVVVTKESFELLTCERPSCAKLQPGQKRFVEYVAEQLRTYPNVIENLVQFKVTKEEFENTIK